MTTVLFNGRCVLGPDFSVVMCNAVLIIVPVVTFLSLLDPGPWISVLVSILFVATLSVLLRCATTDPGIVPAALGMAPPPNMDTVDHTVPDTLLVLRDGRLVEVPITRTAGSSDSLSQRRSSR